MSNTRKAVKISEPSFDELKQLQKQLEDNALHLSLGHLVGWLVRKEINRRIADGSWKQTNEGR
jgi:hypothetical protein